MAASTVFARLSRHIRPKNRLIFDLSKGVSVTQYRYCSSTDSSNNNSLGNVSVSTPPVTPDQIPVTQPQIDTVRSAVKPPNNTDDDFYSAEEIEKLLQQMESDEPLTEMKNPYQTSKRKCILCKYDVEIDYKNVRLLSQFVSPYTGRIYGRQVTGLCIPMQKHIARLIKRARVLAFMPYMNKDMEFYDDPNVLDQYRRTEEISQTKPSS